MKVAASSIARALLLGAVLSQLAAVGGFAQGVCPPGMPPGVFCGERNIAHATAGAYALDPDHSSVLARVSHVGYSYSIFRFDRVSGTLAWNPDAVASSKLSAQVVTESITSNVKGFASDLASEKFLNAPRFPEVTFVSTAFRQTDATSGKVDGTLTLTGKTAPVTFDVTLVGSGKGFGGQPRMGVHASAWIKPQDFGMPAMFSEAIEIVIDAEFVRNP
ncbi:MAG: YceI family protein [Reyranella sp.]|nr:YceI family protein [Reyranella sp.]MDP3162679.1 YceI family protein [Reyranella sp.]